MDGVTATASELNIMDGVTATTAELNHTDGVTSNIQTQLDAKTGTTSHDAVGSYAILFFQIQSHLIYKKMIYDHYQINSPICSCFSMF